jgi:hypothetical protein
MIDGNHYELPSTSLMKELDPKRIRRFPPSIRRKITDMLRLQGNVDSSDLLSISERYEIPMEILLEELGANDINIKEKEKEKELFRVKKKIIDSLNYQILYLPTYRRIEQELNRIFKGIDDDEWRKTRHYRLHREADTSVELIEFGMDDVDRAIRKTLEQLKEFARENLNTLTLGYLGDVVDQKYKEVDVKEIQKTTEDTINSVLDRIHPSILLPLQKEHLSKTINSVRSGSGTEPNEHDKVICHYFLKLLNFQKELSEKEEAISAFCDVCNEYMVDKTFIYDSTEFRFSIKSKGLDEKEREVKLRNLSSGEKQIVSLFSHLYLSDQDSVFLLIDEPELSLSVPWQRRFLMDIKNGEFCSGIVAVTHSPFIYDNELKKYAHALGEFVL